MESLIEEWKKYGIIFFFSNFYCKVMTAKLMDSLKKVCHFIFFISMLATASLK